MASHKFGSQERIPNVNTDLESLKCVFRDETLFYYIVDFGLIIILCL